MVRRDRLPQTYCGGSHGGCSCHDPDFPAIARKKLTSSFASFSAQYDEVSLHNYEHADLTRTRLMLPACVDIMHVTTHHVTRTNEDTTHVIMTYTTSVRIPV